MQLICNSCANHVCVIYFAIRFILWFTSPFTLIFSLWFTLWLTPAIHFMTHFESWLTLNCNSLHDSLWIMTLIELQFTLWFTLNHDSLRNSLWIAIHLMTHFELWFPSPLNWNRIKMTKSVRKFWISENRPIDHIGVVHTPTRFLSNLSLIFGLGVFLQNPVHCLKLCNIRHNKM